MITRATKRELESTMITVLGRKPMNSPMTPGQNTIGRKAPTVVAVDVITGHATSAVPISAAWARLFPMQ